MSIPTYTVNNSTSIVLIDSSRITENSYALVYLSKVDYPGTVVTVRDYIGKASPTKQIVLSTTQGLRFQDGSFSTLINQPFGFTTFTSAPPSTWQILNTYAFANTSEAAYIRNFNTDTFYTSTIYASAGGFFSTLSVGTSLVVGESLTVSSFSTLANAAIGGSLFINNSLNLNSLSSISSIWIGGNISTLGNTSILGSLTVSSIIFNTDKCLINSIRDDTETSVDTNRRFVYWDASLGELVTGGSSATIYGNSFFRGVSLSQYIAAGIQAPLVTDSMSTVGMFITRDSNNYTSMQLQVQNAGVTSKAININSDKTTTFYANISTVGIKASGQIYAGGGITLPSGQRISGDGFSESVNAAVQTPSAVSRFDTLPIGSGNSNVASGLVLDVSGAAAFSGKVGIGRTSVGGYTLDISGNLWVATEIYAGGNITAYSDIRLKTNISTIGNALEKINALRGVYYTPLSNLSTQHIGVIAQEIEQHFPEVVHTEQSEKAMKSVAYGNITAILIEGIKELTQRVTALEATVSTLKAAPV